MDASKLLDGLKFKNPTAPAMKREGGRGLGKMKSVVSSLWSLVGFGQRRRLETAELTLRAALAQRDVYLRQLNDALAACEELRRQRN